MRSRRVFFRRSATEYDVYYLESTESDHLVE